MKTNHRFVQPLMAASLVLALSACAGLQDVDNKWCPPEPSAMAAPVAPAAQSVTQEAIHLQADALFRFDRSGVPDILPEGRAQLDALASQLTSGYAHIDSITLSGHTDRLGPEDYNQRLSQARANTVMTYLRGKGLDVPMQAFGYGESQPVTQGCVGEQATQQLIACLQPDRRVEVQITGVKR